MSDRDLSAFAVVLLAAGCSTRMACGSKLIQLVAERPLLTFSLQTIITLNPAKVIVVTGHQRTSIEDLLKGYRVQPVFNAAYENGMGTSIAEGVRAVPLGLEGVFIHLGDVPFVEAGTYRRLADAMRQDNAADFQVFVPVFEGARGHPVLFRSALIPALEKLSGDTGARTVIAANACQDVVVKDRAVLRDVDTQEDLQKIRAGL
ncbi:MAG: NTP transferase domain-containing protein [Hyphomicrobiaceae bacterium]